MPLPDLNELLAAETEPFDLTGFETEAVTVLQPTYDFEVFVFDKTKPSYWVQWFYSDTAYWTGVYENHITNSRARAYQTFFDRTLDQHFLFPLPITKVALVRYDPLTGSIDTIDWRYN
jgi:hypothetical protein